MTTSERYPMVRTHMNQLRYAILGCLVYVAGTVSSGVMVGPYAVNAVDTVLAVALVVGFSLLLGRGVAVPLALIFLVSFFFPVAILVMVGLPVFGSAWESLASLLSADGLRLFLPFMSACMAALLYRLLRSNTSVEPTSNDRGSPLRSNDGASGKALWWVIGALSVLIVIMIAAVVGVFGYTFWRMKLHGDELHARFIQTFSDEFSSRLEQGQIPEEYADTFEALVDLSMQAEVERMTQTFILSRILVITNDGQVSDAERRLIERLHDSLQEDPSIDPMEVLGIIYHGVYSNRLEQGQIPEEYMDTFEALVDLSMQPEVDQSTRILIMIRIASITQNGQVTSDEIRLIEDLHEALQEDLSIDPERINELLERFDNDNEMPEASARPIMFKTANGTAGLRAGLSWSTFHHRGHKEGRRCC